MIEAWRRRHSEADDTLAVARACWPALEAFLAVQTQWRRAGMEGTPVGLDYAAVRADLEARQVRASRELWEDLKVMEYAALAEMLSARKDRG